MTVPARGLPREISKGVHWLGVCGPVELYGQVIHGHFSNYLVMGPTATLMVDTGLPSAWTIIESQLDELLGGRQLDWLVPTHAEVPHSGNLGAILEKFPGAKAVGEVRDYHLTFPEHAHRMVAMAPGESLDLGGDLRFTFVESVLHDLQSTIWAYLESRGILFSADGFLFTHRTPTPEENDLPLHFPGECGLTTSELKLNGREIDLETSAMFLKLSIFSSRYMDSDVLFDRVDRFLKSYPTRMIASAHGNVMDDVAMRIPAFREMFKLAARIAEPTIRAMS